MSHANAGDKGARLSWKPKVSLPWVQKSEDAKTQARAKKGEVSRMEHTSRIHWIGKNKYQAHCACGWESQEHEYVEARWDCQFEVWAHEMNHGGPADAANMPIKIDGIDWNLVEKGWGLDEESTPNNRVS